MTTTIVGVDFSGRGTGNTTQVTMAMLQGDVLQLQPCDPLPKRLPDTHERLIELLESLCSDAVVGLDFPFSVPWPFGRELARVQRSKLPADMSDLWNIAAAMGGNYDRFRELRDGFVEEFGEIQRRGDLCLHGPISPLKTGGPNMLPMTFRGMQMLHLLWNSTERRFRIPPLLETGRNGPTLLETMPGILLRHLCLPAANYKRKNKTNGGDPKTVRWKILNGLEARSPVLLQIPDGMREQFINNDDCLDSLVAAVAAAMWVQNSDNFRKPQPEKLPDAQLEGWIYVPLPPLSN